MCKKARAFVFFVSVFCAQGFTFPDGNIKSSLDKNSSEETTHAFVPEVDKEQVLCKSGDYSNDYQSCNNVNPAGGSPNGRRSQIPPGYADRKGGTILSGADGRLPDQRGIDEDRLGGGGRTNEITGELDSENYNRGKSPRGSSEDVETESRIRERIKQRRWSGRSGPKRGRRSLYVQQKKGDPLRRGSEKSEAMGELFLRDGYLMSRQRRQSGKESQRRGDYASRKLNDKNKGGEDEDDDDNDDDSDDDEDENEDNDDPSSQKQDRNGMHPRQGPGRRPPGRHAGCFWFTRRGNGGGGTGGGNGGDDGEDGEGGEDGGGEEGDGEESSRLKQGKKNSRKTKSQKQRRNRKQKKPQDTETITTTTSPSSR